MKETNKNTGTMYINYNFNYLLSQVSFLLYPRNVVAT